MGFACAPRGSAEVFEPLTLAAGFELRLDLSGQPEVELLPHDPDLNPSPQIVAWAGGEVTPGSLSWLDSRTGELLYRLEWDLLGRMTLMPRGRIDADAELVEESRCERDHVLCEITRA